MTAPTHESTPAFDTPDDSHHPGVEQLWMAVADANRSGSTRRMADAEDALFRHYLPWAWSVAAAASPHDATASQHSEYLGAAEVGLAQAILAWGRTDTGRFIAFARRLILRRIQRLPGGVDHRRLHGTTSPDPEEVSALDTATGIRRDETTAPPPAGVEVALLDLDGMIVWVNDAWKAFGEANGATPNRTGVGMSYLAVCDAAHGDPYAELVARAIRRAANGICTAAVTIRIPCGAGDGEQWYDVLIVPRTDQELELVGVAVALSSVSTAIWDNPAKVAAGR